MKNRTLWQAGLTVACILAALKSDAAAACMVLNRPAPATPEEAVERQRVSNEQTEREMLNAFAKAEFLVDVELSSWTPSTAQDFMIGHFLVHKSYKGPLKPGNQFDAKIYHLMYNCSGRRSVYPVSKGLLFVWREDGDLRTGIYLSSEDVSALRRMVLMEPQ